MASLKCKQNSKRNNKLSSVFVSDKNIVGFSRGGEDSIIVTEDVKVVKYQLESKRVLQEWRTEVSGNKLSCVAVQHGDRYLAAIDPNTIVRWKNTNTYIDRSSKKFKVVKPCLGLVEQSGHVFSVHKDGSLNLFSDQGRSWSCDFSQNNKIISVNQLQRGTNGCDLIIVALNDNIMELGKYHIHTTDHDVEVTVELLRSSKEALMKFKVEQLKLLFLDELQCVVYGTLKDTNKGGIYLLNDRIGSLKHFMDFEYQLHGDVIQLSRMHDTILISTTKNIFEIELTYKPPLLCNILDENMETEENDDNIKLRHELSFDKICDKLKSWLKQNVNPSLDVTKLQDTNGDDLQIQDFFRSSGSTIKFEESASTEERISMVPLLCQHSFNIGAQVFVEMLAFSLSLGDDIHLDKTTTLITQIVGASLPDNILKNLVSLEFRLVQKMMLLLYQGFVSENISTNEVVTWMNLLLDSHHTNFMISKDVETLKLIHGHVNLLCEEAQENSARKFLEELKYARIQNKSKAKKGRYIETWENCLIYE